MHSTHCYLIFAQIQFTSLEFIWLSFRIVSLPLNNYQ